MFGIILNRKLAQQGMPGNLPELKTQWTSRFEPLNSADY
jgi:hypothetical protein